MTQEVKIKQMNESEGKSTVDAVTLLEAINTVINEKLINEKHPEALLKECGELLEKCQELYNAEVCAIFIVRNGWVQLEAHRGYTHPFGSPIAFETLQREIRYRFEPDKSEDQKFDGITGWVASTGNAFRANDWEEAKRHKSYQGKPDTLKIWNSTTRPFHGCVAVPIKLADKTKIGVLKVENKRDKAGRESKFDDVDEGVLRTLSNCFAVAIDRAQLRSQLTEAQEEIRLESETETISEESLTELALRHDHSHMNKVIERTPDQIEIAISDRMPSLHGGPFDKVFIAGMGGSALPAEVVLDAFADRIRVPVRVVRNYELPSSVNEKSLVIVSSFSGNTEETLTVIERFPDSARNVVVVSADGRLTAMASERRYPLIRIPIENEPKGFQPRSAVGYFVTYFARLFSLAGIMDDATAELTAVSGFLRELESRTDAEEVARWLWPRVPLIYTDEKHLSSIARIAKIKFNENSKRPAFFYALPEANHNEMIGFSKEIAEFGILYLHDPDSHTRILDRFSVMENVFKDEGLGHVSFRKWEIPGVTKIQKIFAALTFADWCSYTLALLDGIDPTPVALVESFKKALASFGSET